MARASKKSEGKSNRKKAVSKKTTSKKKPVQKKAIQKKTAKKTSTRKAVKKQARKSVSPAAASDSTPAPVQAAQVPGEEGGFPWRTLIAGLVLLAVIGIFFAAHFLRDVTSGSLGAVEGTVQVVGLEQAVTIRRDHLGVPYIKAKTRDDLFFGIGYAMAQDRLWQMYSMRMTARGRLAEIIGKKFLETDVFMRSFGLQRAAQNAYAELDIELKQRLARFADGVNAYMRENPRLPIEFRMSGFKPDPWRPEDSLAVGALMQMSLSYNRKEEFAYLKLAGKLGARKAAWLFPSYPDEPLPFREADKLRGIDLAALTAPVERALAFRDELLLTSNMTASNNWALAPRRTKGRASIVANDTHLKISMPSAWMLMHVHAPGYRAAGVAVAGIPFVILGFNGKIAWGATMVVADNQDLFIERLRRTTGGDIEYLYRGRWLRARKEMETFRVKGGKTYERPVYFTIHGPLIQDLVDKPRRLGFQPVPFKPKYGIAVSWTIARGDRTARGMYAMQSARTIAEARRALALWDGIALNIVFGDKRNIAWQVTGRMPRRGAGRGHLPSPGWTGLYDWKGFLPFESQTFRLNPPEGFIGTANHRIVKRPPPLHVSSSWAGPSRQIRLRELLTKTRNATADSMHKMHMDTVSVISRRGRRLLLEGGSGAAVRAAVKRLDKENRKRASRALEILKGFDDDMRVDSAAAAVMGAFEHALTRNTFLDELGPDQGEYWKTFFAGRQGYSAAQDHLLGRSNSPFWDDVRTPDKKETKADILARSLADGIRLCEERMGAEKNWRWGRLHTYTWRHALGGVPVLGSYLNRGPVPAGGSRHTLNLAGFTWGKDFKVAGIPAMRLVVDFSRREPAFLVTHAGQSGNPASENYDSMIEYFRSGRNNPLPFLKENIEKQYGKVLRLEPGGR